MNDKTILVENRDGFSIISLNRPDVLNAFNEAMHVELSTALKECEINADCRAVILTGTGRGFSAGQDLSDRDPRMIGDNPDLGLGLEKLYNPLIRLIRTMETPVICAVNGVAAGAGANIALACDIILAATSAKFIQAFAKIALIPDAGGTYWLTHRLGEVRAKALALTAEPLSAKEAADWGLIWKAVEDDALIDEASALAKKLAANSSAANALTKQAIHGALNNSLDEQLDLERDLQRKAGRTGDYKEGVKAFLEKRPAIFNQK